MAQGRNETFLTEASLEGGFQFTRGVLEPLGSRGYHVEMKNGFSLTLEP